MSNSIRQAFGIILILAVFAFSSLGFSLTARAETNTSQSAQIAQLLQLISQLQAQLAQIQGNSNNVGQCIQLSRALYLGITDSETGGEVSKLQQFLTSTGHYTYGKPTGYFGPATQMAVQAWQKANSIVSGGSPETTGYGVTGPSTRSTMAKGCGSIAVEYKTSAFKESSLKEEIKQAVKLINATTPLKVDNQIRLDKAYELNNKINYQYTVTNDNSIDLNKAILDLSHPQRVAEYCKNPLIFWYRDNNVPMVWHYYNTQNNLIWTYEATVNDCASDSASTPKATVSLEVNGETEIAQADILDQLKFTYRINGEVESCEIQGKYKSDTLVVDRSNANFKVTNTYGTGAFYVSYVYPYYVLTRISVDCEDSISGTVVSDSVLVEVNDTTLSNYKIILDGKVIKSSKNISEAEARSRCLKQANIENNNGLRLRCKWNGDEFQDLYVNTGKA